MNNRSLLRLHLQIVILILLGQLGFLSSAQAQLAVDRMLFGIPFDSKPAISVNVSNTDAERSLRVNVETVRLPNPEVDPEHEVADEALIVSPMHFTLPPGESRAVRILRRSPSLEKEQAFRVNFNPEADDSEILPGKSGKGKSFGIRVLFGVGLLIFSQPKTEKRAVHWEHKDGNLLLKNTGNVNFVVDEVEMCSPEGQCQKSKFVKRIYADGEVSLPWNGKDVVRLRRSFLEESDKLELTTPQGDR